MIIFFYNLFFPIVFLFFLPAIILKLIKRSGHKNTYWERFGFFSNGVKKQLSELSSPVWVHAVSVGEAQIALKFIKLWKQANPKINFVLSTTTTTGQAFARENASDDLVVIFSPIDFSWAVKKVLRLMQPKMLVLFETEIWPNLIYESCKFGTKVAQVNSRISDKSFRWYKRFSCFFSPFLSRLTVSCAQTFLDANRLKELAPYLCVRQTGTMKFDQEIPVRIQEINLQEVFGEGDCRIILGASTHPDEEMFIAEIYKKLLPDFSDLRLVLIPRHAERGSEVEAILKSLKIPFHRRSSKKKIKNNVKCLLADTTGEMLSFIKRVDIVIGGKTFVGNRDGQNIIEPALMGKAIIVGPELRNFRHVLDIMLKRNAVISVADDKLEDAIRELLLNSEKCKSLGSAAMAAAAEHAGATQRTIDILRELL